jgi:hypothetical protein
MKLMIVDVETGGLDEKVHSLLEISAFWVDYSQTEPVQSDFHCIIRPDPLVINPYCYEMHKNNGLLDEAMSRGEPSEVAKKRLKAWFWQQTHGDKFNFCGFCPQFDAKWIKEFTKKECWSDGLIDPRVYLVRPGDTALPGTAMCYTRMGEDDPFEETHRSTADCIAVMKVAHYWLKGVAKC